MWFAAKNLDKIVCIVLYLCPVSKIPSNEIHRAEFMIMVMSIIDSVISKTFEKLVIEILPEIKKIKIRTEILHIQNFKEGLLVD